jgi:hypothetical protein
MTRGREQFAWRVWLDGKKEKLTDRPTNSPEISPDGQWLLCRLRSSDPNTPLWRTALVPTGGKGETRYFEIPRSGGPPRPQWASTSTFMFIDFIDGVANVWLQDIAGGEPKQLTRFDSGSILAYDLSRDGRQLAISHTERVNDIVLIRDFR